MTNSISKIAPLEYVLCLTALAAGSIDVISFTKLGGIFASAMTGNLAFFALYSAAGKAYSAIGSLLALLGFITGVAAGTLLSRDRPANTSIDILLGTETVFLLIASILWFTVSHRNGFLSTDVLILTLSISMGLQSICGKKINLSNIPTIVFTSTLTNIIIAVTETMTRRKAVLPTDTKRQMVSFSLYFAGAFAAGLLVFFNFDMVIALPLAACALAFFTHLSARIAKRS